MQFSKQAAILIRDTVRAGPPAAGQYVRLEGMGNMWITRANSPPDDSFVEFAVVRIDDMQYRIGQMNRSPAPLTGQEIGETDSCPDAEEYPQRQRS